MFVRWLGRWICGTLGTPWSNFLLHKFCLICYSFHILCQMRRDLDCIAKAPQRLSVCILCNIIIIVIFVLCCFFVLITALQELTYMTVNTIFFKCYMRKTSINNLFDVIFNAVNITYIMHKCVSIYLAYTCILLGIIIHNRSFPYANALWQFTGNSAHSTQLILFWLLYWLLSKLPYIHVAPLHGHTQRKPSNYTTFHRWIKPIRIATTLIPR